MFKMAPNSLFAILMHSPWWVSLCLAAGVALVARALLPDQYWVAGAVGGLPFLVIGILALRAQIRAPSPARVQALLNQAGKASWQEFSTALAVAFARDGYTLQPCKGGADFLLTGASRTTVVVAAQRWKAARHGEESLQGLIDAMLSHQTPEGIYVALGDISEQAQSLARQHNVTVLQGADLAHLLRDWPCGPQPRTSLKRKSAP